MAVRTECKPGDLECQAQITSRTWLPVTAGILSLIAGVISVASAFAVWTGISLLPFLVGGGIGFGVVALILGIISIIGGINAVQRNSWGWALAGAITSIFPYLLLGVISIIFVALGKPAFRR